MIILLLILFSIYCRIGLCADVTSTISIVYFYYNELNRCLPIYMNDTLRQAYLTNNDIDIILISNIYQCNDANDNKNYWLWKIPKIKVIDTNTIISNTTQYWLNISSSLFFKTTSQHNNNDKYYPQNPLWTTSTYRFFYIYDFMIKYNYTTIIHCESDTLLYGNLNMIKKQLLSIPKLAATPLSWKNNMKLFTTASMFIINDIHSLRKLLDFFIRLSESHQLVDYDKRMYFLNNHTDSYWFDYLKWLRKLTCCVKSSKYLPDKNGLGLKPFAINEMSMLTYFGIKYHQDLHYLPILPKRLGQIPNYRYELKSFEAGTNGLGFSGLFDPGTYGMVIAGSPHKKRGFVDDSHIASSLIVRGTCRATFQCIKATDSLLLNWNYSENVLVPIVSCQNDDYQKTTLLYTMHIHSKATDLFTSKQCKN